MAGNTFFRRNIDFIEGVQSFLSLEFEVLLLICASMQFRISKGWGTVLELIPYLLYIWPVYLLGASFLFAMSSQQFCHRVWAATFRSRFSFSIYSWSTSLEALYILSVETKNWWRASEQGLSGRVSTVAPKQITAFLLGWSIRFWLYSSIKWRTDTSIIFFIYFVSNSLKSQQFSVRKAPLIFQDWFVWGVGYTCLWCGVKLRGEFVTPCHVT